MSLLSVLDDLWKASDPFKAQSQISWDKFDDIQKLSLALIDVSVALESRPTQIARIGNQDKFAVRWGPVETEFMLAQPANAFCSYRDANFSVRFEPDSTIQPLGTRNLGNTLAIIQYARDHSDSMLFLPPDMRDQKIAAVSKDFGITRTQFRFVAANYSKILDMVSSWLT